MSPGIIGAIVGLIFGLISCFVLTPKIVAWVESKTGQPDPVMRSMRWVDLFFYPVVGYLIGWYFF